VGVYFSVGKTTWTLNSAWQLEPLWGEAAPKCKATCPSLLSYTGGKRYRKCVKHKTYAASTYTKGETMPLWRRSWDSHSGYDSGRYKDGMLVGLGSDIRVVDEFSYDLDVLLKEMTMAAGSDGEKVDAKILTYSVRAAVEQLEKAMTLARAIRDRNQGIVSGYLDTATVPFEVAVDDLVEHLEDVLASLTMADVDVVRNSGDSDTKEITHE
jgi:hypothetical protein